jgi:predicted RNase H-like nuclease
MGRVNLRRPGQSDTTRAGWDLLTVAGIDGCAKGRVVVIAVGNPPNMTWHYYVVNNVAEAVARAVKAKATVIAIDIPIGLRSDCKHRACDKEARKLLQRRHVCIFTPPTRTALSRFTLNLAS